ncbi:MAG: flagellar basal body rod protein FlgB [Burkholderiales bacterium]|nr:flagellar basal body rod protein FlgB [Burkholderiales bacterium]
MLDRLTANLQFQGQALALRAERQRALASNIANADTPGYQARDFDFSKALSEATGVAVQGARQASLPLAAAGSAAGAGSAAAAGSAVAAASAAIAAQRSVVLSSGGSNGVTPAATDARHLSLRLHGSELSSSGGQALQYRVPDQPSIDGNTVDLDRERANFADNSVRYEATLRFITGSVRTTLSAIRGD